MLFRSDPLWQPATRYRAPELLQDIRLLDLLELCGTTVQASRLLNISQPTVSRRYRLLAREFGLEREARQSKRCRYGANEAVRWLRFGCRAHRLAAGFARIGCDLLHQPLLAGMERLLPVPVRFRGFEHWAELVREGVLDGALLSGWEREAAGAVELAGLEWLELGVLPLGLARWRCTSQPSTAAVLVPPRHLSPGLHQALQEQGMPLQAAALRCTGARHWRDQLQAQPLAMPLYVMDPAFAFWGTGLEPIATVSSLVSPVGLLLPDRAQAPTFLAHTLTELMQRIHRHGC